MANAERAAGDGVEDGPIGGAVVGHQTLDPDAAGAVEGERTAQEADRRRRLLVDQHLDVGEPRCVVDADVDELPADPARALTVGAVAARAVARSLADPAELLDVDVDELAGSGALVGDRRLPRVARGAR